MAAISFAEATAVRAVDSHTYTGVFPTDWCIGSVPNGGYVTSTILTAIRLHFQTTLRDQSQPDTITLHLSFLRRTSIGPFTIIIQDTRLGRQTSNLHINLVQGSGRSEIAGYITQSNLSTETGITLPTSWTLLPPPFPKPDFQRLLKDQDQNWELRKFSPFDTFRPASRKVQYGLPRGGQLDRSITDEWIRFVNGERFTQQSLGFVSDTFPQLVEAYSEDGFIHQSGKPPQKTRFWYPTLSLNLDIKKALPKEGVEWLFIRVRAKRIQNGRLDLEVVILDEGGEIVAVSSHVSMIVGSERNTAERRPNKI